MPKQLVSDQTLVHNYINGDESALETLLERHKRKIFEYILKYVKAKDIAEDIFQETFFKVINTLKMGKYDEEGKFLYWVLRISHNLIVDSMRKNKKMPTISTVKSVSGEEVDIFSVLNIPSQDSGTPYLSSDSKQNLRKLIRCLPEKQREVVVMRHYYDMSFIEIAERIDVSRNTALGRMRYALINLRKMMVEQAVDLRF